MKFAHSWALYNTVERLHTMVWKIITNGILLFAVCQKSTAFKSSHVLTFSFHISQPWSPIYCLWFLIASPTPKIALHLRRRPQAPQINRHTDKFVPSHQLCGRNQNEGTPSEVPIVEYKRRSVTRAQRSEHSEQFISIIHDSHLWNRASIWGRPCDAPSVSIMRFYTSRIWVAARQSCKDANSLQTGRGNINCGSKHNKTHFDGSAPILCWIFKRCVQYKDCAKYFNRCCANRTLPPIGFGLVFSSRA